MTSRSPTIRNSTDSSRMTHTAGGCFFSRIRCRSIRAATISSTLSGSSTVSSAAAYSGVWRRPCANWH